MGVFDPKPTWSRWDVGEQIRIGLDTPYSLATTLGENVLQGALDSFGLGTAIREFTTPPIEDPTPTPYRGETRENLEARTTRAQERALSEDEYKASPFFRDTVPWQEGMTSDRAAALAAFADKRAVRQHFSEKQPIAAFVGGFIGQAFDPVNYVPVFGPGARIAAITRYGSIAGRAMLGAGEAAINTAAFGVLTAGIRDRLGDDVSFDVTAGEIAISALIGGAFGSAVGILSAGRDARARLAESKMRDAIKTIERQRNAAITLNNAIDDLVTTGDISLNPNAMAGIIDAVDTVAERNASSQKLTAETARIEGTRIGQVVITPTGRRVAVRPEVVELDTLTHAEGDLQVRNRRGTASAVQVEQMAAELDPARLMPSLMADQGAPLVGEDSIIDSGNGRTMSIRRVYENPAYAAKAEAYRAALVEAGYPDAATMRQPVLINRRLTRLSPEARAQFNAEANSSSTARMSPVETAQMDKAALTDNVMALLDAAPVTAASNRAFVGRFLAELPANERLAMVDDRGNLNAEGARRVENALVAKAYGDVDGMVVRKFAEATDDNTRSIVGALADVAGPWSRFRQATRTGEVDPDLDITRELTDALRMVSMWRDQAAREGRPVSKVISEGMAQLDLLDGAVSPEAQVLIRSFYQTDNFTKAVGRETLGGRLLDIIESGYELGRPSLFGDALPEVTRLQVLENAIRRNAETDLFAAGDVISRAQEVRAAGEEPAAGADRQVDRQGAGESEQAGFVSEAEEILYEQDVLSPQVGFRQADDAFERYLDSVNPLRIRVDAADRPNLGLGDMYGMTPKGSEVVATIPTEELGDITIKRSPEGDFYAEAFNPDLGEQDVVGYIMARGESTELHVVAERQGLGIGAELQYLFRRENPMALSGGLTEAGERALRRTFERLRAEGVVGGDDSPVMYLREDGNPVDLRGFSEEELQLAFDLSTPIPKMETPDGDVSTAAPAARVIGRQELRRVREARALRETRIANNFIDRPIGDVPPPVTPADNPPNRSRVREIDGVAVKFEDEYQAELFDLGDYLLALNDVTPERAFAGDFPRNVRIGPAMPEAQRLWNVIAGHLIRDEQNPVRNAGDFARWAMGYAGDTRLEAVGKGDLGRADIEAATAIEPELRQQWDRFIRDEIDATWQARQVYPEAPVNTTAAPDPVPDGLDAAEAGMLTPATPGKLAEAYGLDAQMRSAELDEVDVLRQQGVLTPLDEEALAAADQLVADSEAYSETLMVAARCVV